MFAHPDALAQSAAMSAAINGRRDGHHRNVSTQPPGATHDVRAGYTTADASVVYASPSDPGQRVSANGAAGLLRGSFTLLQPPFQQMRADERPVSPATHGTRLMRRNSYISNDSDQPVTQRWPPKIEHLKYFLSNTVLLPPLSPPKAKDKKESSDHVEDYANYIKHLENWCKESAKDLNLDKLDARKNICAMQFPFTSGTDKVDFVIVKDQKDPAQCPEGEIPNDLYNVHLLRYFIEQEWKIPRPDVIISVTGGAQAFDLPKMHKDMIMKG